MQGLTLFVGALALLLVPANCQNSYMNALKHGVSHHQRGRPAQAVPALHRSWSEMPVGRNTPRYNPQVSGIGRNQNRGDTGCDNNYHVDYLLLSLMWGPGACATSPKSCVKVDNRLFSIHGMWSQVEGQHSPNFCCFNNQFNYRDIEHLVPMLETYWFSLFNHDSRGFWSHEWIKHGTCKRDVGKLRGVTKYFESTLNIVKRLDVLGSLKRRGIVPGPNKVYSSQAVINGLRELTGGKLIQIDCDLEAHQPTPLLTGVNLCFDTNLNFIDCPPSKLRCRRNVMFRNK